MANKRSDIEAKIRRAEQRRANAEAELDRLSEQLIASDVFSSIRHNLAQHFEASTLRTETIQVKSIIDDNVGPLGGLSSVVRGRIKWNDGEWRWFAINVYCDEESQDKMREQVEGPRHLGSFEHNPYNW